MISTQKKQVGRKKKLTRKRSVTSMTTHSSSASPPPSQHETPQPITFTLPLASTLLFNTNNQHLQNQDRIFTCQPNASNRSGVGNESNELLCSYNLNGTKNKKNITGNENDTDQYYITQLDDTEVVIIPVPSGSSDDVPVCHNNHDPSAATPSTIIQSWTSLNASSPSVQFSNTSRSNVHVLPSTDVNSSVNNLLGDLPSNYRARNDQHCAEGVYSSNAFSNRTGVSYELIELSRGKPLRHCDASDQILDNEKDEDEEDINSLVLVRPQDSQHAYKVSMSSEVGDPCDVTISKVTRQQLSLMTQLAADEDDDSETETYIINTKEDVDELLNGVVTIAAETDADEDDNVGQVVRPDDLTEINFNSRMNGMNTTTSLMHLQSKPGTSSQRLLQNNFTIHMCSKRSDEKDRGRNNKDASSQQSSESSFIVEFGADDPDTMCDLFELPDSENIATETSALKDDRIERAANSLTIAHSSNEKLDQFTKPESSVFTDEVNQPHNSEENKEVLVFLIADDHSSDKW